MPVYRSAVTGHGWRRRNWSWSLLILPAVTQYTICDAWRACRNLVSVPSQKLPWHLQIFRSFRQFTVSCNLVCTTIYFFRSVWCDLSIKFYRIGSDWVGSSSQYLLEVDGHSRKRTDKILKVHIRRQTRLLAGHSEVEMRGNMTVNHIGLLIYVPFCSPLEPTWIM